MIRNKINTAMIIASLAAMTAQQEQTGYTWKGNHYPINNKKGFAAKDKRKKKK